MEKTYSLVVDEVGRITIPAEARELLGIKFKDFFEIYLKEGRIVLRKLSMKCSICNETYTENLNMVGEKMFCDSCVQAIANEELSATWDNKDENISRCVDEFGRIVLPLEIRITQQIKDGDKLVLIIDDKEPDKMLIDTVIQKCFACSSKKSVYTIGSYHFCLDCLKQFEELAANK